jgi:GNAT superfamily N-acetyltransferase
MKSMTHPYDYYRKDGLWIMRDVIGSKRQRYSRKSEVVATGLSAHEVIDSIAGENLSQYFISHLHDSDADPQLIKDDYKANGYRLLLSEGFFVHDDKAVPVVECVPPAKRVRSMEESNLIKKERRNKKAVRDVDLAAVHPEHRLYAVMDDDQAYGWVGSVPFGESSWIADLYVLERFRGRGFGAALMSAVTRQDRQNGVVNSVLLASSAGARLYPHIGYKQIGTLQLFCPKRVVAG